MPGQYDLQPSFPIAGVADLIANRPYKEAQMRQQQQQQLVQGLQQFGEGVNSLVQKRNSMAQAMVLGKNLGMTPEETQGLMPEQVIQAATVKKGYVGADLMGNVLRGMMGGANGAPAGAMPSVASPAGPAPVASTGGPILASQTTAVPVTDATGAPAAPSAGPTPQPSAAVPIQAPPIKPRQINPAEQKLLLHVADTMRPEGVFQYTPGQGLTQVGTKRKGDQVITKQPGLDVGLKEDQFYQKEWDKLLKETDPLSANSRSLLGISAKATFNANRALKTLSNPVVTNQEAGNVMSDIAAIYQNGSPTQLGMSHQEYVTAYGKVQNAIQSLTGKPTDALPNDIKNRLVGVLKDMKQTNAGVLKQRLDMTEKTKKAVISRFPDEWKDYREILEGNQDQYNGLPSSTDQHTEAIKWAQANPNDPRSAAILKKAMDATQGSGGSIGL